MKQIYQYEIYNKFHDICDIHPIFIFIQKSYICYISINNLYTKIFKYQSNLFLTIITVLQ